MIQPAGQCTYCQNKARYSWNIFQKISPYKPKRNPVDISSSNQNDMNVNCDFVQRKPINRIQQGAKYNKMPCHSNRFQLP